MAEDWDAFLEAYSALKTKYEKLQAFTDHILDVVDKPEYWEQLRKITEDDIELEELLHGESISNS